MSDLVEQIAEALLQRKLMLATAESCTGGGIAQVLTSLSGSSEWFDCGFVTYSNEAKQRMLGVTSQALESEGAVSEQVVAEMAEGALNNSQASVSVAVSGIAGPTGGSADKPVGTVWLAWAVTGHPTVTVLCCFSGDRESVQKQAVTQALQGILAYLPK